MTSEALQVRTQRLSTKGRKKKMSRAEPPLSRRVSLNLHQDAERRMYPSFPHGTSRRLHRGRRAGGAIEKKPPTARARQPRETGTQQVTICFGGRRVAAARASEQPFEDVPYRAPPVRLRFGRSHTISCYTEFGNDPSAGSPTETLLRLLLPLNDQVRASSRPTA